MRIRTPLAVFSLLALLALLHAGVRAGDRHEKEVELTVRGARIQTLLADTSAKRIQGLSGRGRLARNQGMLFVFPEPDFQGIWMKDMLFPLDILWLQTRTVVNGEALHTTRGQELVIVDMAQSVQPDTFPQVFYPKEPARYVLELPGGFVRKKGLAIGDTAVLGTAGP